MPQRSAAQERAEEKIERERASGSAFVVAVETTLMPMVIADPALPHTPIVFANAAFVKMSGYTPEEVLGRSYHFLSGPDSDPEVARAIDLSLRAGEAIIREVQLRRKDGETLWVLHHVAPVREDGRIVHHFASFVDITRRKAAEDELRRVNEELDRRVAQRTERLDELNRQLAAEGERRVEIERVLRATLEDKDALLRDKDELVREVNHRVKNSLQTTASLLRAQEGVNGDAAVKEALRSAADRVDRMGEIHRMLHEGQAVQEIEFSGYLRTLCHELMATFQTRSGPQARLEVDADEAFLRPDTAIPLALIVNEAVTNALKYAFPDGRTGRVAVTFRYTSDSVLRLVVADDGVGLPARRRTGSLGLTLVESLAGQIGGRAVIASGKGTTVTVSVPA